MYIRVRDDVKSEYEQTSTYFDMSSHRFDESFRLVYFLNEDLTP